MNRLATVLLICILFSACAHQQAPPGPADPNIPSIKKLADEQTVKQMYECDKKVLPFFIIESHELSPPEPKVGQEFQHSFIYASCVSDPSKPIKGDLSRKIFYRGKPIFQDVSKHVEVTSGKWADVAIIKIPPGAKPGHYNFQLIFSIPDSNKITVDLPFTIKK